MDTHLGHLVKEEEGADRSPSIDTYSGFRTAGTPLALTTTGVAPAAFLKPIQFCSGLTGFRWLVILVTV